MCSKSTQAGISRLSSAPYRRDVAHLSIDVDSILRIDGELLQHIRSNVRKDRPKPLSVINRHIRIGQQCKRRAGLAIGVDGDAVLSRARWR